MSRILTGLFILGFAMLAGCGGGGGDSGGAGASGGGSVSETPTVESTNFGIRGTVNDAYNGQPHLPGVTVSLSSEPGVTKYAASTTTDQQGFYEFTDVTAGNYVQRYSLNGYQIDNNHFPINSSLQRDMVLLNLKDWDKLMGDFDHPYDPNYGYLGIGIFNPRPDANGINQGISGAKISCEPKTYGELGYQAWGYIDWPATETNVFGKAFIYKVQVGQTYTISVKNADTTYPDMQATVNAGEFSSYNFYYYRPSSSSQSLRQIVQPPSNFIIDREYHSLLIRGSAPGSHDRYRFTQGESLK